MSELSQKRVVVTGGSGFLGSHLVECLKGRGCEALIPLSSEWDLREPDRVREMLEALRPDVLIHAAATVGGIGANLKHPGSFFHNNLTMGVNLIECARQVGVDKLVVIGTTCSYPKHTLVPFRESALWDGYPEDTNAPYGLAKKMLLVQLQAYRFGGIYLILVNLYGPGDKFDPESSHVIPAMIRKFLEAKQRGARSVVLWGDGSPTREFLYAKDAARGIVLATERYDCPEPVNIGSGQEVSIKELSVLIQRMTGFTGDIEWDTSKPNGQPRRCLDVSRAREAVSPSQNRTCLTPKSSSNASRLSSGHICGMCRLLSQPSSGGESSRPFGFTGSKRRRRFPLTGSIRQHREDS